MIVNDRAAMNASRALARIMAEREPDRAWVADPEPRPTGGERAERPGASAVPERPATLPRKAA